MSVVGVFVIVGVIIASFVGVLFGIGSLLVGFDRYVEANAIRRTAISTLDAVAVGPVAVRGRIEPVGRPETALYGCEEAVAYKLSVRDSGSSSSTTHVDRRRTIPFDVVTNEGRIRIEDDGFEILASDDRTWKEPRDSYETPSEELWTFERAWDIPGLRAGDTRTYEATYFCPGDVVYAYGSAVVDEGASGRGPKPLTLTDDEGLFFVSDETPEMLLRARRFAVAKNAVIGVVVSAVSLAVFLWLSGIAQVFLGA